MIPPDLEKVLHDSFIGARSAGHRVITIDHLLLRMLDEAPVVEYLKAHSQDVEKLRSELRDCVAHIESGNPEEFDTNPNAAFILLIQKAIARVQVDGTSEVSTLQLFKLALDERNASQSLGLGVGAQPLTQPNRVPRARLAARRHGRLAWFVSPRHGAQLQSRCSSNR